MELTLGKFADDIYEIAKLMNCSESSLLFAAGAPRCWGGVAGSDNGRESAANQAFGGDATPQAILTTYFRSTSCGGLHGVARCQVRVGAPQTRRSASCE